MINIDTQADYITGSYPSWRREMFSAEALTQSLIHWCKGHIFAQIREDGRWVCFDPKRHRGHEWHTRVIYVVTGQIRDRQGRPEILGAKYIHKPSDPSHF